jgi:hypothetical protein
VRIKQGRREKTWKEEELLALIQDNFHQSDTFPTFSKSGGISCQEERELSKGNHEKKRKDVKIRR